MILTCIYSQSAHDYDSYKISEVGLFKARLEKAPQLAGWNIYDIVSVGHWYDNKYTSGRLFILPALYVMLKWSFKSGLGTLSRLYSGFHTLRVTETFKGLPLKIGLNFLSLGDVKSQRIQA